ncbi:nuclear transport factor 2 family protein [Emticicia sp. 17c]|uniref:nuclear transport factor 2 family protein n=1 Tax=Emticicia sp. 17c TaxID=3127704 RepID=UPI00301C4F4C
MVQNNSTRATVAGQTKTASEVLTTFLNHVGRGNPQQIASYFAPDGYIEAPYVASIGMPTIMAGRETIEATMQGLLQNAPNFHFTDIRIIMETATEAIAEYKSSATLTNGRAYNQAYICHVVTKNGEIVSHREFLNTIPFVEAFFPNGLSDLIIK